VTTRLNSVFFFLENSISYLSILLSYKQILSKFEVKNLYLIYCRMFDLEAHSINELSSYFIL